ncbi:Piso0_004683 [Millerozyma farinosa CBS 7064]|uniref:Piso0_004683 protein n=1 Tax=Pichia sorbitophila (strain ATCC MYA-4447 / BCRC 22081 / CBS 7064 / NBRC 10061 / NRRL Y-12695) TaxID=559304 RepID=G8Y9G6_PICSO|nr:Piso0_004683 [Millerozyma farinosa CBS 7064]CCE85111.1 Piso0_004683 [Millerozyma farinosa CBS 7064]
MKLYFESEKYLSGDDDKHRGIKSRIFENKALKSPPGLVYALVLSTLKYKDYIKVIIKKSNLKDAFHKSKLKVSDNLLMLLVNDFLFSGKGKIQSGKHPIKEAFLKNKTRLNAEFIKLKVKHKVKSIDELQNSFSSDETPVRWVRINTLLISENEFFTKHKFFAGLKRVDTIESLEQGSLYKDTFVPHLYGIHPKEKITSTEAYRKGHVIIQDRASCFPAHILNSDKEHKHKFVVDACSAPGNKTTHIASLIDQNSSNSCVFAFERDNKRVETLNKMSKIACPHKFGALIKVTHADFTSVDPSDYESVTGLIVDPSCSGSGIFGRAVEDEQTKEEVDSERLRRLSSFQYKIMKHALSFPSAKRVVYSTCSIHMEENEEVVSDLLNDETIKSLGWELAKRDQVVPSWPRRGISDAFRGISADEDERKALAEGCIRFVPREDMGIGFFAACFIRS